MRRKLLVSMLPVLFLPTLAIAQAGTSGCAPDNAGLKLPPGFCASIFADSVNGVRQIVVAPNGDLVISMQGRAAGGILVLRDSKKTGHADSRQQFSTGYSSAQVALFDGHLYAEASPPIPSRGANGALS